MITVGIIEDMDDYRNLLSVLLSHSPQTRVAFSVDSVEEAMKEIEGGNKPMVCLVDIQLPGLSGIDFVKWAGAKNYDLLCLVCTAYNSDDKVFQSLEAGAHGYLLKSTPPGQLVEAIEELHRGGSPMSSEIARKVVKAFSKTKAPELSTLTPREHELLHQLSQGFLYKEIAGLLGISIETVKRHCFNIYQKLHVQNRTEATKKFLGH